MTAQRYKEFDAGAARSLIEQTERLNGSVAYFEIDIDASKIQRTWNEFKPFSTKVPYVKTEDVEGFLVADANDNYLSSVILPAEAMKTEPVFVEHRADMKAKQEAREKATRTLQEKAKQDAKSRQDREDRLVKKLITQMDQVNAYLGPVFDVESLSRQLKQHGRNLNHMYLKWNIPQQHKRLMSSINSIERADGNLDRIESVKGDPDLDWEENVDNVGAELVRLEMLARFGISVDMDLLEDEQVFEFTIRNEKGQGLATLSIVADGQEIHIPDEDETIEVIEFDSDSAYFEENGKEIEPEKSPFWPAFKKFCEHAYVDYHSPEEVVIEGQRDQVSMDELSAEFFSEALLSMPDECQVIRDWAKKASARARHIEMAQQTELTP